MTLDPADDDPVGLWTHLASAVERLGHGLGGQALTCLSVRGASVERAVDDVVPASCATAATLPALGGRGAALLAVGDCARRERPQRWLPYVEAVVELTRAMLLERGDGATVEHARRAGRGRTRGRRCAERRRLASLAHALSFAGAFDEARQAAMQTVEQGSTESARAWAQQAISFARMRFQAGHWTVSPAHLGLALAYTRSDASTRPEREARRGERLRRSPQPTVGHAHTLLVLARVRVARSRLERAASSRERARADRGVSRPGSPASDGDQGRTGPRHGLSRAVLSSP